MTNRMDRRLGVVLAMVVGLAAANALGQAPADPCASVAPPDDATSLSAFGALTGDALGGAAVGGGVGCAFIIAAVMWARKLKPGTFDPETPTALSKLRNLQLAFGLGQILALLSIAPGVPLPGHRAALELSFAGFWWVVSHSIGGFGVSTATVFGRDWFTRSKDVFAERKAVKDMTTGEFKALRSAAGGEDTPGPNDAPTTPKAEG